MHCMQHARPTPGSSGVQTKYMDTWMDTADLLLLGTYPASLGISYVKSDGTRLIFFINLSS